MPREQIIKALFIWLGGQSMTRQVGKDDSLMISCIAQRTDQDMIIRVLGIDWQSFVHPRR
jgi:hypothetical protein